MVHGRQDWIVPFEQGQKLFDAAPGQSAERRRKGRSSNFRQPATTTSWVPKSEPSAVVPTA